jgi:hypothetical protein
MVQEYLENSFVAVAVSIVILTTVGLLWFDGWFFVYVVAVSWVLSDILLSLIVRGGEGILQIRFFGTLTQPKGIGYLAFLIGIVIATALSTAYSEIIYGLTGFTISSIPIGQTTLGALVPVSNVTALTVFAANCIVGVMVFVDMNLRFYKKSSS